MHSVPNDRAAGRKQLAGLLLAIASVTAWAAVFPLLNDRRIVDERIHMAAIDRLTRGELPPRESLPMLPGVHAAVATVLTATGMSPATTDSSIAVTGPSLTAARRVCVVFTLAALCLYYAAARRRDPGSAGLRVVLLAWNPLFLPYSILVYTEPGTMLSLCAALLLHVRGWHVAAAVALLAACLARQSNVVWVAFMVAWTLAGPALDRLIVRLPLSNGTGPASSRSRLGRLARASPYGVLLALLLAAAAAYPQVAFPSVPENRAGLNVALFYLLGLTVAVLWAPLWLRQLARDWKPTIRPALANVGVCALLVACIGVVEVSYANPHPWNTDPQFLRNRLLELLRTSLAARLGLGLLLTVSVPLLVRAVRPAPDRRLVLAVAVFGLMFLLPHRLADPRYFITPLAMLNLVMPYPRGLRGVLIGWHAILAAATAGYLAAFGSEASGL